MSNINLLPWRAENIKQKNYILGAICGLFGIIVVLMVIIINMVIGIMVLENEKKIEYLNSEIGIYKAKTKEIDGLKERKKMLLTRLEVINALQAKRSLVVNILDKVAISIPAGILLKEMKISDGILTISGNSESNSRISVLMRNLEKFPLFSNPTLKEIKSSQENKVEQFVAFELQVNVLG